jgi:hypoxanthine phosphoribosyltransferase
MSIRPELEVRKAGRELSRIVFTEEQIRARVSELADEISRAYGPDDSLLLLGLLKGSFIFLADLVREIRLPLHLDFFVVSSYGHLKETSGKVDIRYDPETGIEDRHVILVEDIIDSGTTLRHLIPLLEGRRPRSLEVCTLLHKGAASLDQEPRWVGFEAPREFLVGYGLDYGEDFRHLPYIGSLD